MANANGAFGLRAIGKVGQNTNSTGFSGYTQYEIASDNSNSIFQGSPVIPLSTGFIDIVGAAAGGTVGLLVHSTVANTYPQLPVKKSFPTFGLGLVQTLTIRLRHSFTMIQCNYIRLQRMRLLPVKQLCVVMFLLTLTSQVAQVGLLQQVNPLLL